MATITPTASTANGITTVTWTGITTTTDTPIAYGPVKLFNGPLRGAVTMSGTFNGGTTAVLQGSVDGTVYATLTDIAGNAISATAAKLQEFESMSLYYKPSVGSGSADDVTVTMILH